MSDHKVASAASSSSLSQNYNIPASYKLEHHRPPRLTSDLPSWSSSSRKAEQPRSTHEHSLSSNLLTRHFSTTQDRQQQQQQQQQQPRQQQNRRPSAPTIVPLTPPPPPPHEQDRRYNYHNRRKNLPARDPSADRPPAPPSSSSSYHTSDASFWTSSPNTQLQLDRVHDSTRTGVEATGPAPAPAPGHADLSNSHERYLCYDEDNLCTVDLRQRRDSFSDSSHDPFSAYSADRPRKGSVSSASSTSTATPSATLPAGPPAPAPSQAAATTPPNSFTTPPRSSSLSHIRSRSIPRAPRLLYYNSPAVEDLKNVVMIAEGEGDGGPKQPSSSVGPGQQNSINSKQLPNNPGSSFSRTDSVSSASINLSTRTVTSTNPSNSGDAGSTPSGGSGHKHFVQRNGRAYLNDSSSPYPLPCDLPELHRQSLLTLLLVQVFGAPVCCPALTAKPPLRVLEIGCGAGFWSMLCHRYFKSRGHSNVSFTGIDVAPMASNGASAVRPDKDMKWQFIQHDLRSLPMPFEDGEFDLVFSKDMTLAISNTVYPAVIEESIRVLKPGGIYEVWETDHMVRMLRPHVPSASVTGSDIEEQEAASSLGAYVMNANTPLSAPLNTYLVEYNNWVSKAAEARSITTCPCTILGPQLLMEPDLTDVRSRRLAIPFGDVRWEREGVGGVVNKGGKSYVKMSDAERGPHQKVEKKTLTAGQTAIRRTALQCLVQEIQSWEPILREACGKSQDEWDLWFGKMAADLMSDSGTSWGECLEAGAWWARKK